MPAATKKRWMIAFLLILSLSLGVWAQAQVINQNYTLTGDEVIDEDLHLMAGTLDLDGHTLTINGNFYHEGGNLLLNGGSLIVQGDYRMQSVTSDPGGNTYGESSGYVAMSSSKSSIRVEGDFITQTIFNHTGAFTNGVFEIKGNFEQKATGSGSPFSFNASGLHRMVFSGSGRQEVRFAYSESGFHRVTITNPDVHFMTETRGWTLEEEETVIGAALGGFHGTLDLNGKSLEITGDLHQIPNGTITFTNGTLAVGQNLTQEHGTLNLGASGQLTVGGDYRIQSILSSNGTTNYGVSMGVLNMTGAGSSVTVGGTFATQSSQNHGGNLTNGLMEVKGDFYQRSDGGGNQYNFNTHVDGGHHLILSGDERQHISFSSVNSGINYLTIQNEDVVFLTVTRVRALMEPAVIANDILYGFAGDFILAGNLTVRGHFHQLGSGTLVLPDTRLTVEGDFIQKGTGGVRLGIIGSGLTVGGDLRQEAGLFSIKSGELQVGGDYRLQIQVGEGDDAVYSPGTAILSMQEEAGEVRVQGDFIMRSSINHGTHLTAGLLMVGGDFRQIGTASGGQAYNLNAGGTHRVILNGTTEQIVSFDSTLSGFKNLSVDNANVTLATPLRGWVMDEFIRVAAVQGGFLGTLDLNGQHLWVDGDFHQMVNGIIQIRGGGLRVVGDLTQEQGQIDLNGGTLNVLGDYRMQKAEESGGNIVYSASSGVLKMIQPSDSVWVGGSFITHSIENHGSYLTNGIMEVRGDFIQIGTGSGYGYNFNARTSHRMVLSGTETQTVSFDSTFSGFNHITFTNSDILLGTVVRMNRLVGSAVIDHDIAHGLAGDFSLNGDTLVIKGNLHQGGNGNIGLSGGELIVGGEILWTGSGNIYMSSGQVTVAHDLIQSAGAFYIEGGVLDVGGDYRLQTRSGGTENPVYGAGAGVLGMDDENDLVYVGGNFITESTQNHGAHLRAGTMTVRGDFQQIGVASGGPAYNFNATQNHRVILDGTGRQEVAFESHLSGFSQLLIRNPDTHLMTPVRGWTLQEHTTIAAAQGGFRGTLNINGYNLVVSGNLHQTVSGQIQVNGGLLDIGGNLIQENGELQLEQGRLKVGSDYRIQSIGEEEGIPIFGSSMGSLSMLDPDDRVEVAGTFATHSFHNHGSLLQAGTMVLMGDFRQIGTGSGYGYNFNAQNAHTVHLAGTGRQEVYFDSEHSRFNHLHFFNDQVYFMTPVQTWAIQEEELTIGGFYGGVRSNFPLNGKTLHVTEDWLQEVSGNVYLNGGILTIGGRLIQAGGMIDLQGGQMQVAGDYRLQSREIVGETEVFSAGSGVIKMNLSSGQLSIGGDFVTQSTANHVVHLTDGVLELKGDFQQIGQAPDHNRNFRASENHHVILSGDGPQEVFFDSTESGFAKLSLENQEVHFTTPIRPWAWQDDAIVLGSLIGGWDGANADLGGRTLRVLGDYIQTGGGRLYLSGGSLHVDGQYLLADGELSLQGGMTTIGGDLRIQSVSGVSGAGISEAGAEYGTSNARLSMDTPEDYIRVKGNFVMQSALNHSGYLSQGLLEVGGDFIQLDQDGAHTNNFDASNNHQVFMASRDTQTIHFDNVVSGFANLLILDNTPGRIESATGYRNNNVYAVTVNHLDGTLPLAGTLQMEGSIEKILSPAGPESPVGWSSLNVDIVSVSTAGLAEGHALGFTRLRAAADVYPQTYFYSHIEVVIPVTHVTLNRDAMSMRITGSDELEATVWPNNAGNRAVIWSSSHPDIAQVVDGLITPVSHGSATITVTTAEGGYTAECTVQVEGVYRIAGGNRYQTSVAISQEGWPEGASTVVLARGDDFADALAGVPLAYQLDAPILLTATHVLPGSIQTEITRLGATRIILLGGAGAISDQVKDTLQGQGLTVERLSGTNRFTTAVTIAEAMRDAGNMFDHAVLAVGTDFPDALAAGSYAAQEGYPILLTRTDILAASTSTALNELGVGHVLVTGGTGVISENAVSQLPDGITWERISGANRYETGVALAGHFNRDVKLYYLATGLSFPDAITGSVLAAKEGSGILLVNGGLDVPNRVVREYLQDNTIRGSALFGGSGAIKETMIAWLIENL